MHETAADTAALQQLLDTSYARIGAHMRTIHTPDRRVAASDLARVLRGVRVLDLATVTAIVRTARQSRRRFVLPGPLLFRFGRGVDALPAYPAPARR